MNCDGGGVPRTTSGIDQEDGSSNTSHRPSMSRGDTLSRFRINILTSTTGKSVSRPQISTGAHMRGWSKSLLRLCARAICPSGGCGWKLNQIKGKKRAQKKRAGWMTRVCRGSREHGSHLWMALPTRPETVRVHQYSTSTCMTRCTTQARTSLATTSGCEHRPWGRG